MNLSKFFALVGIFSTLLQALPTDAAYHKQRNLEEYPNYVVIGAFAIHKNAIRFTNHAHKDLHLNAKFEMNYNRNLYYVYVLNTTDLTEAIQEARRLRDESELKDTWVYRGWLGKKDFSLNTKESSPGIDINPMTEKIIDPVSAESSVSKNADASSPNSNQVSNSVNNPVSKTNTAADTEISGKKYFFKIYRALDNDTIHGDVDVIDVDRSKKIGTYKGNIPVRVSAPSGKSGHVSLICEVFGYRKVQRDIDYNNPSGEGIVEEENSVVVPFELMRLQKGDIAVMYNVYFFKDAAIMRPESRYEVNSLLEMLQENEKYKIKIHGHTNGGAPGKIISLPDNSTNFFSLANTTEGFGSAKKLSEERANLIKMYLVSNGIDPKRMQTKPWGGKRPIHHKHHTRAQENVRVEIEILEN